MADKNQSKKFVLAIDQGTTSSRAVIYDSDLKVVAHSGAEFPQYYPQADWVEHDLGEIWTSVTTSIKKAVDQFERAGFEASDIVGIGITNQRETFGLWDRKNGEPVHRAIVWQCRRSAAICEKLKKSASAKTLQRITGLVVDPYFSGTKTKWLLDTDKKIRDRVKNEELAFGTMDTFLIWKLTAGEVHSTDVTNASRTLFMDLKTRKWSVPALKILGIPESLLPKIESSDAVFGVTRGLRFLPDNIPICGVLGDQQAALFGQACFKPGEGKVTYGTGAFYLLNTGSKILRSRSGLTTMAWEINKKPVYALEGSVFIAGAAVQWLRDNLEMFPSSSDIQRLAESVPDSDGVFFIPALSGLGAPDWAPEARGLIGGLTRRSNKNHVARACLEGIAHSVGDGFEGLVKDSGMKLKKLRADGGAAANGLLLQIQANILQTRIQRPKDLESTARGAASMAALSLGLIKNTSDLAEKNPITLDVTPQVSGKDAKAKKEIWARRKKALLAGAY